MSLAEAKGKRRSRPAFALAWNWQPTVPMSLSTGLPDRLGSHLLTTRIGQGELTQVFDAQLDGPPEVRRRVVVKTLLPMLAGRPECRARLHAEARISALLHHPNLIELHDVGTSDGVSYLVFEHLEGRTLEQLLQAAHTQGRPVPVGAAVAILRQLCDGLGYAHNFTDGSALRQSIVHGDVSPSNVFLCRDGTVKLIDFGRARIGGRFAKFSVDALRGSRGCRAPEQIAQRPIDVRLDVFCAGVVGYQLLAGKPPFADTPDAERQRRAPGVEIVEPSQYNSDVPRALDDLLRKALAHDPADRFASGAQMALSLDRCGTEVEVFSRDRLAVYYRALFDAPTVATARPHFSRQAPLARRRSPRPPRPLAVARRRAQPHRPLALALVFGLITSFAPFSLDSARFGAEERIRPPRSPSACATRPRPADALLPPSPSPSLSLSLSLSPSPLSGARTPGPVKVASDKRTRKPIRPAPRRAAIVAPAPRAATPAPDFASGRLTDGGIVDPFAAR